jgi:hypothetical protein
MLDFTDVPLHHPERGESATTPLALRLAAQWEQFRAGRPSAAMVSETAAELRRLSIEVSQLRNLLGTGSVSARGASGSQVDSTAAVCHQQGSDVARLEVHIGGERTRFEAARDAELRSLSWSSVPDRRAALRFARAMAARLWGKAPVAEGKHHG